MIRMRKQGMKANDRCLGWLLLTASLVWMLSGCGSDSFVPEFPPTVETVQNVAEKLGWTLDPEGTKSWADDQILYDLEIDGQTRASVSCALVGEKRFLTENCVVMFLPDKPQFAWEDWEKTVTLAETLYGGFAEGELYQALSEQDIPEPEISTAELDTPIGRESLNWEVELPMGYGRVQWSIDAGTVEHNFPSPIIRDWRVIFNVSLYESKNAYESLCAVP